VRCVDISQTARCNNCLTSSHVTPPAGARCGWSARACVCNVRPGSLLLCPRALSRCYIATRAAVVANVAVASIHSFTHRDAEAGHSPASAVLLVRTVPTLRTTKTYSAQCINNNNHIPLQKS